MNPGPKLQLAPERQVPRPPTFPSPARQVLHMLVSVAGWLLFLYWWSIVLREVSRRTVEMTGLFLLVSLVLVVVMTVLWTWHNQRLFERKGPRTQLREVPEDYSQDIIGRAVAFEGSRERIQSEPEVEIVVEPGRKTYRAHHEARTHDAHGNHGGGRS
jgi:hypothetical protein